MLLGRQVVKNALGSVYCMALHGLVDLVASICQSYSDDSAILRIDPYEQLRLRGEEIAPFFDMVRAGFGQRRKQLHNALVNGLRLPAERVTTVLMAAGVDGRRRAETLQVTEWITLYRALGFTAT